MAFGQAVQVPVFYRHERFNQIIAIPKAPFAIDLELIGRYPRAWADLAEPDAAVPDRDLPGYFPERGYAEEIAPLLDSIEQDGKAYSALSALGLVYWEAFLARNLAICLELTDVTTDRRRGCHIPPHHYPRGFEEYVQAVYDEHRFITACHGLSYDHQKGIVRNEFHERDRQIFGTFLDRSGFGARFEVMTEARNALERRWVIQQLDAFATKRG